MHFTKVQGTGSDFVLIEAGRLRRDWSQLARTMCERRYGVGGDGLILLLSSKVADFRMRVFKIDGSEIAMSGNAIRCLARYVFEAGLISEKVIELAIETMSGIRKVELKKTRGKLNSIKVNMGIPGRVSNKVLSNEPQKGEQLDIISPYTSITVDNVTYPVIIVSVDSPHAVCFIESPVSEYSLETIGPAVEKNSLFKERTSLGIARVINTRLIEARVWESGTGEKKNSCTGACAVGVAAQLNGYAGEEIDVKLPAGTYTIEWDGNEEAFLTANADIAFTGEWPE